MTKTSPEKVKRMDKVPHKQWSVGQTFGVQKLRYRGHPTFALISAEAKQSSYIAHMVQFRQGRHVEQFNVAENGRRDNGLAHIIQFAGASTANWTVTYDVRIEMTATGALDRAGGIVLAHDQNLHFPHFERTEYPAQSSCSALIASGLAQGFRY